MGIEPTYLAWKASVLPLNHARKKVPYYYIKKWGFLQTVWAYGSDKNDPRRGH